MFKKIFNYIAQNKMLLTIVAVYVFLMISVIDWGIPNLSHPYTYHMDEWHQLQSINALYKYGSPNVPGAANGTIFQFLLSGVYLTPFVFLKFIDPSVIKSGVESLLMQKRVFEILRFNTLIFGILSMITFYAMVKKYFKTNPIIALLLFTTTPLWFSLSNYFKYDIALTFWIILSLYLLLRYGEKRTLKNYILAGIACSLAIATKISAIPLLIIYIFSFFYFNFEKEKKYRALGIGLLVFISVLMAFGIPDLILQKGDYREYLYSNLVRDPQVFKNFILEYKPWFAYILLKILPLDFGYSFYLVTIASIGYWLMKLIPKIIRFNFKTFKNEIFLFIALMVFIFSLIPLELGANGNRLLVLLPFFAIFSGLFILKILNSAPSLRIKIYIVFILLFILQFFQSFAMIYIKWQPDPRQLSSDWMSKNLKKNIALGIENIPIYQELPDLVVKEFYSKKENNVFKYTVVDAKSVLLPDTIIVTNKELDLNFLKKSQKKDLVFRLNKEQYRVVQEFKPQRLLYNIMGNEFAFYSSGIVPISTITIYEQDKNPQN